MKGPSIARLLAVAGSGCLAGSAALIASTPPASGWEQSIYQAYPPAAWALLAPALASGIAILILQSFAARVSRWWLAGLLMVIVTGSLFLSLPLLRGYWTYGRADTLTHIGWTRDILLTGHIAESDFYPVTHLIGAEVVQITGLPVQSLATILSVAFFCLYIAGMFLLGKLLTSDIRGGLLLAALASPFVFTVYHVHPHPTILSVFALPIALYLYHRASGQSAGRWRYLVLLLPVLVIVTLFHPVTAVMTALAFCVFALTPAMLRILRIRRLASTTEARTVSVPLALVAAVVVATTFGGWYFASGMIERQYEQTVSWVTNEFEGGSADETLNEGKEEVPDDTKTAVVQTRVEQLSLADLTPLELVQLGASRYGAVLLCLAGALAATAILARRAMSANRPPGIPAALYSGQYLIALTVSLVSLFTYAADGNEIRTLKMPLFFGTICMVLVIWNWMSSERSRQVDRTGTLSSNSRLRILAAVLAVGVPLAATMSLSGVYSDHINASQNMQVSHAEAAASDWFSAAACNRIDVAGRRQFQMRQLLHSVAGVHSSACDRNRSDWVTMPGHFGYDECDTIAEALGGREHYVIVLPPDLIVPLMRRTPGLAVWTQEDVARLNSDETANRIYECGGVQIWRVPVE